MSKRKGIGGTVKRDVWLKYVGNKAETKCFCCKKNVIMLCSGVHNTWQAGHLISHHNGGKADLENLHPICKQCNNAMDSENWDDYVDRHINLHNSLPYLTENYYQNFEKGIIWWQSLYRMHLSRINNQYK
jgi:5-methylcytosine-specific restriction endonuclease McrA